MTFTIRRATDDDLGRVAHLVAHAYLADGLIGEDHPYLGELRDAAHRADQATVLVAVQDRAVLGTVTLALAGSVYAEIARPGEVEIRMLAVDPAARGRGVGEALVRAAAERGLTHGVEAVVLTTMSAMLTAQRMYVRLGFVRVRERDWFVDDTKLLVYRIPAAGIRVRRDRRGRGVRVADQPVHTAQRHCARQLDTGARAVQGLSGSVEDAARDCDPSVALLAQVDTRQLVDPQHLLDLVGRGGHWRSGLEGGDCGDLRRLEAIEGGGAAQDDHGTDDAQVAQRAVEQTVGDLAPVEQPRRPLARLRPGDLG